MVSTFDFLKISAASVNKESASTEIGVLYLKSPIFWPNTLLPYNSHNDLPQTHIAQPDQAHRDPDLANGRPAGKHNLHLPASPYKLVVKYRSSERSRAGLLFSINYKP